MKQYSSEEIIEILRSFTKFEISKDFAKEIEVWQEEDNFPSGSRGFQHGSFTRDLLELIEYHMSSDEDKKQYEVLR